MEYHFYNHQSALVSGYQRCYGLARKLDKAEEQMKSNNLVGRSFGCDEFCLLCYGC